MGFTEVLTIVFVVLKLLGVITWVWWIVLLPEILAVAFYLILLLVQIVGFHKVNKSIRKHFDEF